MPAHVPPVADERAGLLEFLAHQRRQVRAATFGLSDAEAAATPSASSLSLGGIVKHLAHVERNWADIIRATPRMTFEDYVEGFRFGAGDSLVEVLDDYEASGRETEKLVADIEDLGEPVPVPRGMPWFPQDVDAWSVRWVLLHLIEETARHAGHADIVRESLDGAAAGALRVAADNEGMR